MRVNNLNHCTNLTHYRAGDYRANKAEEPGVVVFTPGVILCMIQLNSSDITANSQNAGTAI